MEELRDKEVAPFHSSLAEDVREPARPALVSATLRPIARLLFVVAAGLTTLAAAVAAGKSTLFVAGAVVSTLLWLKGTRTATMTFMDLEEIPGLFHQKISRRSIGNLPEADCWLPPHTQLLHDRRPNYPHAD